MSRSPLLFGMIGGVGFLIDACILTFLSWSHEFDLYAARCISFCFATFITWWLNRSITFEVEAAGTGSRPREYARYVAVQVGGALINYGIFAIVISGFPIFRGWPFLPLAIGAAGGLLFNYQLSRAWVFRDHDPSNEHIYRN
jgi:putative flippase GtrA